MSGLKVSYFILKPKGDSPYAVASRNAMREYAASIEDENPELAADLKAWVSRETDAALRAEGEPE